eukprot:gnl/TRDRNA2_/TRDRNA2_156799_c0_seq2.p1 gnl/TRDRNA2_/TRDRNA2_156799_c0~~gnl/TRDRNA2_/TRDRNA2_156799_c0_seq2.p1  ORF type:complete len:297 (+),score=29.90 gnl/TRDRNA2_/TRDRNA2_156799_c0_seq2:96-986(+)
MEIALKVQTDPSTGRCFHATRDVSAGEILLTARPFAAIVKVEKTKERCYNCFCKLIKLPGLCCDKCRQAYYCSDACRDALADIHKIECTYLHRLASAGIESYYHSILRVVLRMLSTRLLSDHRAGVSVCGSDEWLKHAVSSPTFEHMLELENNQHKWDLTTFQSMRGMQKVLAQRAGDSQLFRQGTEDAVGLMCRQICNGFSLVGEGGDRFGMACFPAASFFNHSCAPNAVHTTLTADTGKSGWVLQIRAAQRSGRISSATIIISAAAVCDVGHEHRRTMPLSGARSACSAAVELS